VGKSERCASVSESGLRLIAAEWLFSKTFDLVRLVVTNYYLELYYLFWLELMVGVMLRDWPLGGRFL
jgi:hypothetical protein